MLPESTDVLIVAAGPAGLALAATLQQAGVNLSGLSRRRLAKLPPATLIKSGAPSLQSGSRALTASPR